MTLPFSLLGRALPGTVGRAVHVLADGHTINCDGDGWRNVLAVVEHGAIEIRTAHGACLQLEEGASFCLTGLDAAVIRCAGASRAVVATAHRLSVGGSQP